MTRRTATLVLFPLLTACAPQDDAFPTADAGYSVDGEVGQESQFDGSASYGEALSFAWSLGALPDGSSLSSSDLLEANTPWPVLRPDMDGVYVLDLEVCDVNGHCDWSQVELRVGLEVQELRNTQKPLSLGLGVFGSSNPRNEAPVPIGFAEQGILANSPAVLNGDESYDPEGEDLTYVWTFVSVPEGSKLTNSDIQSAASSVATFYPDVRGTYKMRLKVSDGRKWASKILSGIILKGVHDPDPVD